MLTPSILVEAHVQGALGSELGGSWWIFSTISPSRFYLFSPRESSVCLILGLTIICFLLSIKSVLRYQ